jgi:pyridoxal phosphate enzyme (YggS family)
MPEARWHLVGHLQTNKVNKAVANFALIQSVDSTKLAESIAKRANTLGIEQAILLQINISTEETKSGFSVNELLKEFPKLIKLKGLKIEGLMTIAPELNVDGEQEKISMIFKSLADLKRVLETDYKYPLQELSMGMSNDYKLAIQQGSTMIRIGRSFFEKGPGQIPKSVVK